MIKCKDFLTGGVKSDKPARKLGKLLSRLLLLLLLVSSCTDDDVTGFGNVPLQVSVTANSPLVSRAIVTDEYLPDATTIGVTVTDADGNSYDNQDYFNVKYTAAGTGEAQTWTGASAVSLSTTVGKAVAYYPWQEVADLTAIPVETASQTDYMYSKPVTGLSLASPAASFTMQHALTDIRVKVIRGDYTGIGALESVSVKSSAFATGATLNVHDGSLASISGADTEFKSEYTDKSITAEGLVQDYLVVPVASVTSGDVSVFVVIDGKKFTAPVQFTETFLQGKTYIYEMTLDNKGLSLTRTKVTPWNLLVDVNQAAQFYDDQYIVEIQVPSDGYTFTPNIKGYTGVVDWGDGTTTTYDSYTSYPEKHIYSTAGTYVFKLTGKLSSLGSERISVPAGYLYPSTIITKLVRIGKEMGVSNMDVAFYNQKKLTEIVPGALDGCTEVADFGKDYIGCFEGCTALTNIPEGLFDKCTEAENFGHVFNNCNALTSIPAGLFDNCTKVEDFAGAFEGCRKLQAIPVGLFDHCTKVKSFYETFGSCSNLEEIPEGLFDACTEATNFGRCFAYCNINNIPANLFINNTQVENFDGTFYYCTALTSIPEGLFNECTEVTNFGATFAECRSLTSIPAGLFENNAKVTDFVAYVGNYNYGCFNGCTGLTSIPAGLFDKCTEVINFGGSGQDHDGVFGRCKNLEAIPEGIFDKCTKVSNFGGIFHGCKNLQSIPKGLFDYNTEVLKFTGAFYGCEGLTEIPEGLFDYNTKVTEISNGFYGIFRECKNLKTIPVKLFDSFSKITKADNVFFNCNKITNIPEGLFDKCTEVTSFAGTFYDCTALQTIPEGLFDNCTKVSSFYETFVNCSNLEAIPEGLFDKCTEVTRFDYAFLGCRKLQAIPEGLFDNCTKVTNFSRAFENCYSLQAIPEGLFNKCTKVTSFSQTFYGCSALTGESPYTLIDGVKVHLYERSNYPEHFTAPTIYTDCFFNCTGLTDYASILSAWK